MSKIAVTVIAYALVPADDYDERLGDILSGFERGLQDSGADYVGPQVVSGIPAAMSDAL